MSRGPSRRQKKELIVRLIALPALLVVILGFQNCAPSVTPVEPIPVVK